MPNVPRRRSPRLQSDDTRGGGTAVAEVEDSPAVATPTDQPSNTIVDRLAAETEADAAASAANKAELFDQYREILIRDVRNQPLSGDVHTLAEIRDCLGFSMEQVVEHRRIIADAQKYQQQIVDGTELAKDTVPARAALKQAEKDAAKLIDDAEKRLRRAEGGCHTAVWSKNELASLQRQCPEFFDADGRFKQ